MELINYLSQYKAQYGDPIITLAFLFGKMQNAENTQNRKAFNNISWIRYWQELTGFKLNNLKCTSCGKEIYIDIDLQTHPSLGIIENLEEHQAIGAHIVNPELKDVYFIFPLCPSCNSLHGEINVKINNRGCMEKGAIIED